MEKFIESHRTRVKRAKLQADRLPEKISRSDMEAFVEFYLLEDVLNLIEWRLAKEKGKTVETRGGELAHKSNLAKFTSIKNVFEQAVEIVWAMIDSGNYKVVWRSIPERALMKNASNIKNLPKLRAIGTKLLEAMMEEMRTALVEDTKFTESLDDIESHNENVSRYQGLPSMDEIEEVIKAAELAIPEIKGKKKDSPILN